MATVQCYRNSSFFFATALFTAVLATGCCGPMACGPMGRNGCGLTAAGCGGCDSCSNGCGERYIDEWINHPPKCDSCDSCGNQNGQTCGGCRPIFDGFASLWGYRRDCGCAEESCGCSDSSCVGGCSSCSAGDGGCSSCGGGDGGCSSCGGGDGGCSSCGGGDHASYPSMGHQMEHDYVDSPEAIPMPHRSMHSPQIVHAKPAIKPYQPQRTKQIFRPKATVATSSMRTHSR